MPGTGRRRWLFAGPVELFCAFPGVWLPVAAVLLFQRCAETTMTGVTHERVFHCCFLAVSEGESMAIVVGSRTAGMVQEQY